MDDLHPVWLVLGFFALAFLVVLGGHYVTVPPAPAKEMCADYGRLEVCTLPDGTRCALTGDPRGGIDCDWAPVVAEKK